MEIFRLHVQLQSRLKVQNLCCRPEASVYIQQGCMEDFIYSATLMIPNEWKYSRSLRVLQEGAQCKVFAGTYGLPKEKGRGVIALEAIEKGQCILEYTGEADLKGTKNKTPPACLNLIDILDGLQCIPLKLLCTVCSPAKLSALHCQTVLFCGLVS